MFNKKQPSQDNILDEKISLKKRELEIVKQEIELVNKLGEVNKFAELLNENYALKKENLYLQERVKNLEGWMQRG